MMAVRPIIFSSAMVRALLDGRKTMTRRVLKPQPYDFPHPTTGERTWNASGVVGGRIAISDADLLAMHRYRIGDLLWVKERYAPKAVGWFYETDTDGSVHVAWGNPRFMPKVASRLTLEVTGVKVERVQDISEADAVAEGAYQCDGGWSYGGSPLAGSTARGAFYCLWESLNAERGHAWETNPFVVAITFKVHKANVDALNPSGEGR